MFQMPKTSVVQAKSGTTVQPNQVQSTTQKPLAPGTIVKLFSSTNQGIIYPACTYTFLNLNLSVCWF